MENVIGRKNELRLLEKIQKSEKSEFSALNAKISFRRFKQYTPELVCRFSKKGKGLSRTEIIATAKLPNAGSTSRILKELEESGFIRRYISFGKKEKNALYQLSDFWICL